LRAGEKTSTVFTVVIGEIVRALEARRFFYVVHIRARPREQILESL